MPLRSHSPNQGAFGPECFSPIPQKWPLMFISLFFLNLLWTSVYAGAPPQPPTPDWTKICRELNFAVAEVESLCAIAAFATPSFSLGCGIGGVIATFSVRTLCFAHGNFIGARFPPIATKFKNGTVLQLDGSRVHDFNGDYGSTPTTLGVFNKRTLPDNYTIHFPTIGDVPFNANLLKDIGLAAESPNCPIIGMQKCIPNQPKAFLTCTASKQWVINQV